MWQPIVRLNISCSSSYKYRPAWQSDTWHIYPDRRAVLTQYWQYLSSQRAHLTWANNKYFAQDLTTSHCHTVCIIFKNYTNYSCWDPGAEAVREMWAIWLSCCSRLVSFLQPGDATALLVLSLNMILYILCLDFKLLYKLNCLIRRRWE